MRTILFVCLLFLVSPSHAQVSVARAKLSANFGFMKYGDIGAIVQFDNYFTVGVFGNTITDDLRVKNPTNQTIYSTKLNKGQSVILYAGITSPAPDKIHFTGLAGISVGEYDVHDNVEPIPHPSGSLKIVSDSRIKTLVGIGVRGGMTFALGERGGVNAGVLAHVNPKFSYFRVYIGLSLGRIRNVM